MSTIVNSRAYLRNFRNVSDIEGASSNRQLNLMSFFDKIFESQFLKIFPNNSFFMSLKIELHKVICTILKA